jgi:hypothetical protein
MKNFLRYNTQDRLTLALVEMLDMILATGDQELWEKAKGIIEKNDVLPYSRKRKPIEQTDPPYDPFDTEFL